MEQRAKKNLNASNPSRPPAKFPTGSKTLWPSSLLLSAHEHDRTARLVPRPRALSCIIRVQLAELNKSFPHEAHNGELGDRHPGHPSDNLLATHWTSHNPADFLLHGLAYCPADAINPANTALFVSGQLPSHSSRSPHSLRSHQTDLRHACTTASVCQSTTTQLKSRHVLTQTPNFR